MYEAVDEAVNGVVAVAGGLASVERELSSSALPPAGHRVAVQQQLSKMKGLTSSADADMGRWTSTLAVTGIFPTGFTCCCTQLYQERRALE